MPAKEKCVSLFLFCSDGTQGHTQRSEQRWENRPAPFPQRPSLLSHSGGFSNLQWGFMAFLRFLGCSPQESLLGHRRMLSLAILSQKCESLPCITTMWQIIQANYRNNQKTSWLTHTPPAAKKVGIQELTSGMEWIKALSHVDQEAFFCITMPFWFLSKYIYAHTLWSLALAELENHIKYKNIPWDKEQ